MALTAKEAAALAIIGVNEVMLKGQGITARGIKTLGKAAVKLTPWLARGAVATAPGVARTIGAAAAASPVSAGLGIGTTFLASPPGQQLLGAAAERGQMDRVRAQQAFDEWWYGQVTRPAEMVQQTLASPTFQKMVVTKAKRKVSKYGRAIKVGMAAVKKSKFGGKPGKITNAKSVFSTVSKVTSAVNRGKKVASKGIRGTVARAVRRIL
jgi:hypothetical protein